nr:glycosyltransferase [uncultured Arsenicibacter sp.]
MYNYKIKILFICSSLESGKDGVGDYTSLLAYKLLQQGHSLFIVALNDKYVETVVEMEVYKKDSPINTCRIPANLPDSQKIKVLKKKLDCEMPDIISLQFVPFGFNKRGLPFSLMYLLTRLKTSAKWHIMFHELWVGPESLKLSVLGMFQKVIIKRMVKALQPSIVHTQLPHFAIELKKIGVSILPTALFSNIPVSDAQIYSKLNIFTVVFFSQISSDSGILRFLKEIENQLHKLRCQLQILILGGSREKMLVHKENFSHVLSPTTHIEITGFIDSSLISAHLKSCDLGITPMPLHALGKSGTVAAFLSHGLPVAVPLRNTDQRSALPFFFPEAMDCLMLEPDLAVYQKAKAAVRSFKEQISVKSVSTGLLADFKNAL